MKINDPFWTPVQRLMMDTVLPYQYDILEDNVPGAEKSHAVQNFRIAAGEAAGEFYGMCFQDSDVAKWLEAVAYALEIEPNEALAAKADAVIDIIGRAQQADGYLNTYFIIKEPQHKWQNLLECHELYCAGHLIEAAVAYYEATGKDALLNTLRKYADHICARFGAGAGKIRGIPGHQEIELALYRLYKVTGEKQYLQTAQYFIDERGKQPSYFKEELARRDWYHWNPNPEDTLYAQNHLPVRRQTTAVGHSVRAVYMYTAMAALAAEGNDDGLLHACKTLWHNIVHRQMYITGGIGATYHQESFTTDYDLPNDTVYAETCASIAMVFFAKQMLGIEPLGEYADIMELQLFNGILSGMQLDGKKFFYVNPLESVPGVSGVQHGHKHALPTRPEWFGCACCPPNVARLMTSLGHYAWGEKDDTIFAHLYMGGTAHFQVGGGVQIDCRTNYPWDGEITYTLTPAIKENPFTLAIRLPAWSADAALHLNGHPANADIRNGYAYLTRPWQTGDTLTLTLNMTPRRVYAHTKVRANAGCVALMRGPLVYCFEECDNGADLAALQLPRNAEITAQHENMPGIGGIVTLHAAGQRRSSGDALYSTAPPQVAPAALRAIPYYAWANRAPGGMRVWMHE